SGWTDPSRLAGFGPLNPVLFWRTIFPVPQDEEVGMRSTLRLVIAASALVVPALVVGGAFAQDARGLLQAADKASGASKVNSFQFTGKGRYAYPGQNFTVNDDWNRVDLQSYVLTIDYPSKSYKEDQVRVQGNNPRIGGGAGFPIVGEQKAAAMG